VPEAEYNLLSTYQATSRGASFTFTKDRLDIDMQGERLLTMQPRDKLFVLRSNAAKASNAALVAKGATAQEWHERYGHLGYQNLARLIKEDMVTGIDVTAKDIEEASKDTCDNILRSRDVVFGKGERSKPLQETTHTPDDTLFKFDNGETQERHPDQDMPAESEEPAERTADDSSNDNEPDTAAPMLRRSERVNKGQRNDTWYMGDGRGSLPVGAGAALIATEMQEPNTLEEALSSEYAEQWQAAMDDEMSSLHANKTWTLESLPPGKTAIPVKWVYKIKHNVLTKALPDTKHTKCLKGMGMM